MTEESQVNLTTASILNVPLQIYDNDFLFIVNGEKFKTSRLISDLLSPTISKYHQNDPTMSEFTIKTKNKGHFSFILQLCNFNKIKIPASEIPFFSEVIELLGNKSIEISNNDYKIDAKLTEDNAVSLLRQHQIFECLYGPQIEDEIDFISTNFYKFCDKRRDELEQLSIETLERIILNPKLCLRDENQLLEFVNFLNAKSSEEYKRLYDYILFCSVDEKALIEFIDIIDFDDVTRNI